MTSLVKDAAVTAAIVALLLLPLAGARTVDGMNGLTVEWHLIDVGIAAGLVFVGRFLFSCVNKERALRIGALALLGGLASAFLPFPSQFLKVFAIAGSSILFLRCLRLCMSSALSDPTSGAPVHRQKAFTENVARYWKNFYGNLNRVAWVLILVAVVFPFTPFASRYALDVSIMVMTYIMLAWGLNITVGYAGLLDLGYAGFYALGAYCTALLAQHFNIGFWTALPLSGVLAAVTGFVLGLPVLRLRGDYFAVVTLGFGEIVRLVVTNFTHLTNGPNGISDIPHPTLFGLEFTRQATNGARTFNDVVGLGFNPVQRVIYLYFIILGLALAVGWMSARLRVLPLGRAWEAFRENEIATAALGIHRWGIKLAAYSMGAAVAGLAGSFFATRQGFISPESFTFTESATMLAIVILGGIGHPLGIALAAIFIIGLPEAFRDFEQYRMLAFGAGMVLIMMWRPGGLVATRTPSVWLKTPTR